MNIMMNRKQKSGSKRHSGKAGPKGTLRTRAGRANSNAVHTSAAMYKQQNNSTSHSNNHHNHNHNTNSLFNKYEVMLKIGVDMATVLVKMRKDNIQPFLIDQFVSLHTHSYEHNAETLGLPKKPSIPKPQQEMKKIYWEPIELNKIKSSIWYDINQQWMDYDTVSFALQFQQTNNKSKIDNNELKYFVATEAKHNESIINFISSKRSQQVQNGLKLFKITNEQLRYAILSFDETYLTMDKINTLINIIPTIDEQLIAQQMSQNKNIKYFGVVERFFYSLHDIIELKERLQIWLFKLQFDKKINDLQHALSIIEQSKIAIMKSDNLKGILAILLAFGNHMNCGYKSKDNAYGFNLNNLSLLPQINTCDGITFPMYLCTFLQTRYPKLLDIVTEFNIVGKASNINTYVINKQYDELNSGLKDLNAMLTRYREEYIHTLDCSDSFVNVMTTFEQVANQKLYQLKHSYEAFQTSEKQLIKYFAYNINQEKISIRKIFKDLYNFIRVLELCKNKLKELTNVHKVNKVETVKFRRKRIVKTELQHNNSLQHNNRNKDCRGRSRTLDSYKTTRSEPPKNRPKRISLAIEIPKNPNVSVFMRKTNKSKNKNNVSLTSSESKLTPVGTKDHCIVNITVDDNVHAVYSKPLSSIAYIKTQFQNV